MNTVLVVSNHGEIIGGGEISLLTLLKGLDRSCWAPVVVVPSEGPVAEGCRVLGVPVRVIPLPGLRRPGPRVFSSLSSLVRLIKETGACLVHANGSRAMLYAGLAGWLSGRSVVWHLRISDMDPQLDWLLVRMATRIIAISESVKARLKRWPRAHGRCVVVPNGLDLAAFVTDREQAVVRGSLGIGPEERVIGQVGRLVPFKGHRFLIQAFAGVRLRHPSARLLIVGDGPERASLEQQVDAMGLKGAVHFTGHRRDVPDMLSIMEIFVLPSIEEHFGRVLLEAMALEKPVVGTRAGGVPEVVEDGVTGVLVPPANSDALAEGVIRLMDDPAQARAMGRAGRRRVETHFNLRRHAELVEEVYAQALGGEP